MKNVKLFTIGEDKIEVLFFKEINEDDRPSFVMKAYLKGTVGGIGGSYDTTQARDENFDKLDEEKATQLLKSYTSMIGLTWK